MTARYGIALGLFMLIAPVFSSNAAIVPFILDGKAGQGLLPGNENPAVPDPGSGGLGPGGISYDTDTNILSIDIKWGSGNGFTDLTGNVSSSHIHGMTASPPPLGFTQNAGVLYTLHTLPGFDTSATNGGFVGTVSISEGDEAGLLAGRTYINVHTIANGGGEIRGQLTAVPIPAAVYLFATGLIGLIAAGRRKTRT